MDQVWGIYGFTARLAEVLHPEDRPLEADFLDKGGVAYCAGQQGEYFVLRFGDLRVRVKADKTSFHPIAAPLFDYGDMVRVKPPRTVRLARIRAITMHHKRKKLMYCLRGGGAKACSSYLADELEKVDATPGEHV